MIKAKYSVLLAIKHANNPNSRLCRDDALKLFREGKYQEAKARAAKSLQYSVGVFHKSYQLASR